MSSLEKLYPGVYVINIGGSCVKMQITPVLQLLVQQKFFDNKIDYK
jgi:hypothetical protein